MKTFVLLYHGTPGPTADQTAAWEAWFQRRVASFVDVGHAFGAGRQLTAETTIEWSVVSNPVSGYSVIVAPHIDAAEQLVEGCPIVDGVSVFEALPNNDQVPETGFVWSPASGTNEPKRFFEWPRSKPLAQTNREEEI